MLSNLRPKELRPQKILSPKKKYVKKGESKHIYKNPLNIVEDFLVILVHYLGSGDPPWVFMDTQMDP